MGIKIYRFLVPGFPADLGIFLTGVYGSCMLSVCSKVVNGRSVVGPSSASLALRGRIRGEAGKGRKEDDRLRL